MDGQCLPFDGFSGLWIDAWSIDKKCNWFIRLIKNYVEDNNK